MSLFDTIKDYAGGLVNNLEVGAGDYLASEKKFLAKTAQDIRQGVEHPIETIKTGLGEMAVKGEATQKATKELQVIQKKAKSGQAVSAPEAQFAKAADIQTKAKLGDELEWVAGATGAPEDIAQTAAKKAAQIISQEAKKFPSLEQLSGVLKMGQKTLKESKPDKSFLDQAMTELYDRFQPLNKFLGGVEKILGRKLTYDESAYVAARTYAGVSGKITSKLTELGEALRMNPEMVKNGAVSDYLFAQRAIERAGQGFENPGGITADVAQNALKDLQEKLGANSFKSVQKTAAAIYDYGRGILDYIHNNGIISDASYDAIKARNQMYVPFDVVEHLIDNEKVIPSNTMAFSVASQNLIKSTKGTLKEIDEPINALVRKTIKTLDLVERNNVAKKVYQMKNMLGKSAENFVRDYKEGDSIIKGWDKVSFIDNGEKRMFTVPNLVADVLHRLSAKQADMLTRTASLGTRALRAGATSFNIAFIIPNAFRDFETATLVSKYGFNMADWSRGFWQSLKASASDLGIKVDDSIYQNYLKSAGEIGGYYSTYLNDIPKTVKNLTKPQWQKVASLINPIKAISEMGKVIERTPRLGVFMKALSNGETPTAAGFMSREATVDFSKMGETGRILNLWVPFINARLQGEVNIAKSLKAALGNPKRMAELSFKIAGLSTVPFVASYYSNIKNFPQVWKDIADYEKANNVILILGSHKDDSGRYDQIIKFPKGDWNYFIDPIQDVLEYINGNTPNLLTALAENSLMDYIPLSTTPQVNVGKTIEQGASQLLPTPIKAAVQDLTNMDLYKMRPIVNSTMAKASAREQYQPYTPQIAKVIGDWLNISPLKIQSAINTTFAGLGTQMLGLGGTVAKPQITLPVQATTGRFIGAYSGGEAKTESTMVDKWTQEMADRNVKEERQAQTIWTALQSSRTPQQTKQLITDIGDQPGVVAKLKTIIENNAKGVDYVDKQVKALSPKERAGFIIDHLKSLTGTVDKQNYILEITQKGLLTPDTITEMKAQLSGQ